MARFLAVLRLLQRLSVREFRAFSSITANNFTFFLLFLLFAAPPPRKHPHEPFWSTLLFQIVILIPLLFSVAFDTLACLPESRRRLWPFSKWQQLLLRCCAIASNPSFWALAVIFGLWMGFAVAAIFVAGALIIQAIAILLQGIFHGHWRAPIRMVPKWHGRIGGIVRIQVQHILTTLDFYLALLLCIGATLWRLLSRSVKPDALPIIAMVIALALSTITQCAFNMDVPGGLTRYRQLPLSGRKLLLAKDLAYLLVASILTAPLGIVAGLTFSFVAVAAGRYPSLRRVRAQQGWRLVAGHFQFGVLQIILGGLMTLGAIRVSLWFLAAALGLYLCSLYLGQRWWTEGIRWA